MCTKGEWNRLGWLIVDKDRLLIADCRPRKPASVFDSYTTNMNTPVEEITANAQLIASAPLGHVLAEFIAKVSTTWIDDGLLEIGEGDYIKMKQMAIEALSKAEE